METFYDGEYCNISGGLDGQKIILVSDLVKNPKSGQGYVIGVEDYGSHELKTTMPFDPNVLFLLASTYYIYVQAAKNDSVYLWCYLDEGKGAYLVVDADGRRIYANSNTTDSADAFKVYFNLETKKVLIYSCRTKSFLQLNKISDSFNNPGGVIYADAVNKRCATAFDIVRIT